MVRIYAPYPDPCSPNHTFVPFVFLSMSLILVTLLGFSVFFSFSVRSRGHLSPLFHPSLLLLLRYVLSLTRGTPRFLFFSFTLSFSSRLPSKRARYLFLNPHLLVLLLSQPRRGTTFQRLLASPSFFDIAEAFSAVSRRDPRG